MDITSSSSSSSSLQQFQNCYLICFFFPICLFFLLIKKSLQCNCEICHSYLTSNWRKRFNNLCDWHTDLLQKSPTQTIHIHVLGNTITANPQNVEHILGTNFHNYLKGKSFSAILGDLLGKGIFNVDGDLWFFQRKMASLELGMLSIRSYAYEIVATELKNRLLPTLSKAEQSGRMLDLQEVFRRFSFDNICRFSFGLDPGCLELSSPSSSFADCFDQATKLSAERALSVSPMIWKMKKFLNIGSEKKLRKALEKVDFLAREVIMEKRKLGFSEHRDLLSKFMTSVNDDKYLRDIVISFILAGRDTVASALTIFFWLLSNHPEVARKIREESESATKSFTSLPSFEQIRQMHYLHAAVCESMRLYPPIQFDSKFAEEDDVLPDGTLIHKGTRVTYHPYAMGRMDSLWGPDRLEFKPERWMNDNGVFSPENPFKYPVYQAGIRVCLGKEMALMEIKVVAVTVLRRFDLQVNAPGPEVAPRFVTGLTATIDGGVWAMIKKTQYEGVPPPS